MKPLILLLLLLQVTAAMKPVVRCTTTNPAVLGGTVSLTCEFPYRMDVLQVTWEKKRDASRQNMVTHSTKYGVRIARAFDSLIKVLQADTSRSSITISKLEREDEACYICIFNTYPDGAFTGEVCLTNLALSNEVTCSGEGKPICISMTPAEIRSRWSVQSTKISVEGPSIQKGLYIDGNIHPTCTFQVLGARRKNRSLQAGDRSSPEGLNEEIITQCSASGKQRPVITWDNEGNVVSREYKENTTNNITTVTSTRHHSVSSLSTDFRVTCSIKHEEPELAVPHTDVKDSPGEDEYVGDSQKTNADIWDKYSVTRLVIVCAAVVLVIVPVISYYAYHRLRRKSTFSASQPESPHLSSPLNISNKISKNESYVENGEVTPFSSTKKNYGSDQGSSVTKRKPSSTKKENSKRRLQYS